MNDTTPSPWRALAVTASVAIVACALSCIGCFAWLVNSPDGGVLTGSQLPAYARDLALNHEISGPDERVLVFYDESLSLDGSSCAFVTSSRVVYLKDGLKTSFDLADVKDIQVQEGDLGVDIIIEHVSGERMMIEIAALNRQEVFVKTLMDAWIASQGE